MPEPVKQNGHRLNQEAKGHLRQVRQKPDPEALYLPQLMLWGLNQQQIEIPARLRTPMRTQAEALQGADPDEAMKFLGLANNQDEVPVKGRLGRSALLAASQALQLLNDRMTAQLPQYPPTSTKQAF